jgi:hypothetical protein
MYLIIAAWAQRTDDGLPEDYARIQSWLDSRIEPGNKIYIPEIKRKKLANPEIAKLENYSTKIPEEFWDKFQKREIPSKPETRINTDTLEKKIMGTKGKLLPHQFERAKKALSFLKYGA